ncbi:STN domain-containing protein [Sphingobium yanoikuyae]|uniref:STN domain-containing protein n=1 Tax=Sphingobium yanoikuyae TaxID=13690 RepID=UPI000846BEE9|nr:STN domain-containing protein [Sphingobium yanoikuyae]
MHGGGFSDATAQETSKTYDLPEQDLAAALRSVAHSSDYQLVADPKSLKGARVPSLAGAYTVEEAVTALLAPSGLTAEIRDRTITLRVRDAPSREEVTGATDVLFSVTGTRIKGAKISSPVIEVTQSEMRLAGQNDLGEVVRSMPQSFGGGQNPGVTGGTVGLTNQNLTGGSSANPRGLGADATLTTGSGNSDFLDRRLFGRYRCRWRRRLSSGSAAHHKRRGAHGCLQPDTQIGSCVTHDIPLKLPPLPSSPAFDRKKLRDRASGTQATRASSPFTLKGLFISALE